MRHRNTRLVYGEPLLLATLSALGLMSALFGDGVWDWSSWFLLGSPVVVGCWYLLRRVPGV